MATFTILEPMSTGDVIDRALRLYRRNFAPLLSIVALPSFTGYLAQTMLLYGYSKLLLGTIGEPGTGTPDPSPLAIVMLIAGIALYPVWLFMFLATIAGLSRVIGDHIMLNEPITFRKSIAAARKRLGDIFLMALLAIAIMVVVGMIFYGVVIVVTIIVLLVVGATAASGIPAWLAGLFAGLFALIIIGLGIAVMLVVASRVIFLPQVVMIEGQSPGQALGRAMQLGKGNWYKVGAIILFNYFISLSLLTAITLPVLAILYFADVLTAEFIAGPTWNLLYTSFSQLINLLSLPIQMIAFTLLYFDSRVRKEAYDIELLAREVNPGFYWQPTPHYAMQGYATGYQTAYYPGGVRIPVQTSPLGLAGWVPPGPTSIPPPSSLPGNQQPALQDQISNETMPMPENTEAAASEFVAQPQTGSPVLDDRFENSAVAHPMQTLPGNANPPCNACGAPLEPEARFCMRCGKGVEE
jgi:hypothetical protein